MWALKPPSKQFNSCNLSSICNPYSGCQATAFFKQSHICVCTRPTDLVSVFRGGIDPFRLYFTARQESRRRRRRSSFRPKELFFSQAASSSGTVLDQLFPVRFFFWQLLQRQVYVNPTYLHTAVIKTIGVQNFKNKFLPYFSIVLFLMLFYNPHEYLTWKCKIFEIQFFNHFYKYE